MDDPEIHVREFESIMSALLGGEHSSCILAGECFGKYFAVDPKGEVYHCDEFMNDPKYRLGNLVRENFQDIISGPQIETLKEENKRQIQKLDCKRFPCVMEAVQRTDILPESLPKKGEFNVVVLQI